MYTFSIHLEEDLNTKELILIVYVNLKTQDIIQL